MVMKWLWGVVHWWTGILIFINESGSVLTMKICDTKILLGSQILYDYDYLYEGL